MANELKQRARELLAAELRLIGPEVMNVGGMDRVADSVINGTRRFVVIRAAIRAIVAALQQAQQQSRGAARRKVGTASDSPTNLDTPPQQPGAQAVTEELIDEAVNCAWHVAGTTLHSREDIKAAVKAIYPMFVGKIIVAPPPPLPEGVSEEDVEAAVLAFDLVGPQPEWRSKSMRAALESYRARLAAKGAKS